ncbi:hypothetical protein HYE82_03600 [Streptomyces sp. BR123]|jgi:hypothetical protein|uniref:hypothetical protein n=1 Tax=Streptomyces sp. BR123 TaxID=2749828 RepID=UPI0015C498D6|nr:hypothetical protein [Streptomyces sp. BR123]NXY93507.1 hypothetical protein [Streptomyces sp. BR123]
MRVKALEALSLYYNYGVTTLAEGEEVKGGLALHLLETGANVEPLDADAAAYDHQPEPSPKEPESEGAEQASGEADAEVDIDGTAADILAWVDGDEERAAEALALELAKDKPRSTLAKQLEKLAAAGAG